MTTASPTFQRDRLTWFSYSMLAFVGFMQAILGPILPSLRADLNLNYTQSSFFSAAIAIGMVIAGITTVGLAKKFTRTQLLWGSSIGICVSVSLLSLLSYFKLFELVLLTVVIWGVNGAITQVMIQAILSDRHGELRTVALSEANVAASLFITFTPLIIGGFQSIGIDWRAICIVLAVLLFAIYLAFRPVVIPDRWPDKEVTHPLDKNGLPFGFWLLWMALFFIVSIEMSVALWTPIFLFEVKQIPESTAILLFGLYPASQVLGRLAGSQLARKIPTMLLLLASFAIALLGFPLMWLSTHQLLVLVGMAITGLGISNLYPLTMSMAVGIARGQADLASARISLAVGLALLIAPLAIGGLADRSNLQNAFGLVLALMAVAIGLVFVNKKFQT